MDNLKLEVTTPTGEITIREGDAKPYIAPKSITIDGVLSAPAQFLAGKVIEDKQSHLRIFGKDGRLELYIGDTDPETTHVIKGSLTKSVYLRAFEINSKTYRFEVQSFLRFIKENRYFFANKEQHGNMVRSMQKWSGNIETVLQNFNDNKGNTTFLIDQKVRAADGFIDKFELEMPIFQGDDPMKFTVEIGLEPKNAAINIYLFSDELFELEITRQQTLMERALSDLSEYEFSKIVVN